MGDPGKHVAAEIRYEIAIISPSRLQFLSTDMPIDGDIVVLQRITTVGNVVMDRAIAGIIGGPYKADPTEFIRLHSFLCDGGVIGLHRDLQR